jgi:putative endonuclease
METYTVYIICNPQKIYYKGFTSDILRRLEEHNSSIGKYTSEKGPWTLVFKHSFISKSDALKYERMLKRQNHKYLDWLIAMKKKKKRNEIFYS